VTAKTNLRQFLRLLEYEIAEDIDNLGLLRGAFKKIFGRKPLGYCPYHGTHGGTEMPEKCPGADK
jgi:hypothetical protein